MAIKWPIVTIAEIAAPIPNAIAMGPFGSDIKTNNFVPSGVPVIRGGNLTSGRFNGSEFVYLTESKADQLRAANAFPGDVVFTHRGTLGQVGIIPTNTHFKRYVVSQSQMKLTCDRGKADPAFIYYFFRSDVGQQALLANTSTTGVPAISRPLTSLKSIAIPLPPLEKQRAIASILGALDDKIDLNRRMNETLEAIARALFTSWFVDFDPVRAKMEGRQPVGMDDKTAVLFPEEFEDSVLGEVPKGWLIKPLDQVADFLNGLALQKYPPTGIGNLPVIKIAELRRGVTDSSGRASSNIDAKYIVEDGNVLFSWSGSLGSCIWTGGRGALNQHLFKVTSAQYPKWFYYHWIKEHLPEFQAIAAGKATTMGHIQRHHLADVLVLIPPTRLMQAMDDVMEPLLDRHISNSLTRLRLRPTRHDAKT